MCLAEKSSQLLSRLRITGWSWNDTLERAKRHKCVFFHVNLVHEHVVNLQWLWYWWRIQRSKSLEGQIPVYTLFHLSIKSEREEKDQLSVSDRIQLLDDNSPKGSGLMTKSSGNFCHNESEETWDKTFTCIQTFREEWILYLPSFLDSVATKFPWNEKKETLE